MLDRSPVYVVEDDANFRRALVWLLESVGHRCLPFASAGEFLDHVDTETAGCLITDLRMPAIGGIQLLERLRAGGIDIPVIIVTAYGTVPASVHAMKLGAVDFLEKPFDEQRLLDLIGAAQEKYRTARQQALERQDFIQALETLSPREDAVLRAALAGQNNPQIAAALGIGVKSVETYRLRVLQKTAQDSWADLRVTLERLGIVT